MGYGCPNCVNKTEGILFNKLIESYPNIIQQYKVDWCKNKTYLPFDFCIEEHKIIIELDGDQHFKQVSNWESPEKTQQNDMYKMSCANLNGYSVIRLLQDDVFSNKYDWASELIGNINLLIANEQTNNIFMCKSNEYDQLIKLIGSAGVSADNICSPCVNIKTKKQKVNNNQPKEIEV